MPMPPRIVRAHLVVAAICLIASTVGGCWTSRPAGSTRLAMPIGPVIPPVAWPARDRAAAVEIAEKTPRKIWRPEAQFVITQGKRPADPPDWVDYEVAHASVYGEGVIRVIRQLTLVLEFDNQGKPTSGSFKPTDEIIRFVSRSTLPNRPVGLWELSQVGAFEVDEALTRINARMQNATVASRGTAVLVEGLGGKLHLPKGPARGLVIHLGGIGSGRYERSLLGELRGRDWAMFSVPFVGISGLSSTAFCVGPDNDPRFASVHNSPSLESTLDPVVGRGIAAKMALTKEIFPTPAALGERFAAVSDDRVAEVAYFIEALLAYLEAQRPEVPRGPLVLVASSAGALCAPAVAARLGDRLGAAVVIGGGTNLMKIGLESAYEMARPRITWATDRPEDEQRRQATDAYLAATRLDPIRTAAVLRHLPVLQVHGKFDRIVPAETGIDLWKAMGEPDRLDYFGGHEFMFWGLSNQTGYLAEWIERHAPLVTPPPQVVDPDDAAKVR